MKQAQLLAFGDMYALVTAIILAIAPLVILIRRKPVQPAE